MTLFYANQYVTTTLSKVGGLNNSDTAGIALASTDGVETTKPGIALLDYQDPLDTSKAEWITYTSINGSKELQGVVRGQEGSTAKAHDNGCAVAFPMSKSHVNNLNDAVNPDVNSYGVYNDTIYRQAIVDGGCQVAQGADGTLSTAKVYGKVDIFYGIAEGTVGAGTITQTTSPNVGTTGTAFKLSGITLTGSGKVKMGYRMEARDAVKYKNQIASFSIKVYHDVGSAKTYTIYLNKANSSDNFAAVTAISNNGGTSINTSTATTLKYENVSLGDCSNGLEILVECNSGAITTKNFEFTELTMNLGSVALPFMPQRLNEALMDVLRYYEKSYAYATAPGTSVYTSGAISDVGSAPGHPLYFYSPSAASASRKHAQYPFAVVKRTTPTVRYWDGAGNASKFGSLNTDGNFAANNISEAFQAVAAKDESAINGQTAANISGWFCYWDADARL